MLLSSEQFTTANRIVGYDEREVRLVDTVLTRTTLLTHADREPLALTSSADLDAWDHHGLLRLKISILLITSPEPLIWPSPQFKARLAQHGIGLEVLNMGAAARTFNLLLSDWRPVGLLILLG